jgi:hypothetical protein
VTLTLLVRAYCHLCDEMHAALAPLATAGGAAIAVVDVDADPSLEAAWGEFVPVLFAGDPSPANELCRYRLDPARVAAALRARGGESVAPEAEIR